MNLAEVLDRATDQVASPGLADRALQEAVRRRARRHAVAGSMVAVVVVIGGVVMVTDGRDTGSEPTVLTPSPTPTDADDPAIGRRWDPASVASDPVRASLLPDGLAPPELPPNVDDDPMEAAIVAWPEAGHDLRLLGTDGRWRCVKGTADLVGDYTFSDTVAPVLSHDGTQVAMGSDDGILVVDLTTGDRRTIPWPEPLEPPYDTVPQLQWLADGAFAAQTWPRTWIIESDGDARRMPYGRGSRSFAVDSDGVVYEKRYDEDVLQQWRGDEQGPSASVDYWGERLVADFGRVAFTGGGSDLPGDGGPIVLNAETGDLVAYRPIRDPQATYSDNGHLTAMGFLDADTVVYLVGPAERVDRRVVVDAWHLITWDIETGEFERLTIGAEGMQVIDVAVGILARG